SPREKRARFVAEWKIAPDAAGVLTSHPRIAAFFEETATLQGDGPRVANFILSEVLRDTTTRGLAATFPVTPPQLESLLNLASAGKISGKQAKEVYQRLKGTDADPKALVSDLGMRQITDASAIEEACNAVIDASPKQVADFKAGKSALFGYFVGQVMKATKGSA